MENDDVSRYLKEQVVGDTLQMTLEEQRKRWLCHLIRNPIENLDEACRSGLVRDRLAAEATRDKVLDPLVKNPLFFELISFASTQDFIRHCSALRDRGTA
jgi:hypothetical protein